MVQVDYEAIDLLLQARKISRRQLAKLIGISPEALAASFRRKSKMKVYQLWQIAHILSVNAADLLLTDENGKYNEEDLQKVESEKFDFDFNTSEDEIGEINLILEKLNLKGLQIVKTIASALSEISELKADYTVLHGSTVTGETQISPEEYNALMNSSVKEEEE